MMELIQDWEEKINKLESDWQLWEKERLKVSGGSVLGDIYLAKEISNAQRGIRIRIQVYTECLNQVSKLALAMSDL